MAHREVEVAALMMVVPVAAEKVAATAMAVVVVTAAARRQAPRKLAVLEGGVGGCDDAVGVESNCEAASEHGAVHCTHHRHREGAQRYKASKEVERRPSLHC